ncbi:MAG: nucleotide pyrophosphohydrolase [Candidatus Heimdallarchaeota archaeon]|nr:nucleotide pyrophosphohydrolase [Candidatus Heimdallarchaeota archaeon]MCK4770373.1 nucleotide pyrophosphohydrolase [Candidatus Heimdallarchaeota archaeon]
MKKLYFSKDLNRGKERTVLRLVEELGELSEAVLLKNNDKISEEIADVIAWTLSIANLYEIDVDETFNLKYKDVCPECNKCPCVCESI